MEDEVVAATLAEQFVEFAKMRDEMSSGDTIRLYWTDYWMRQGQVLDDRRVRMTDTGIGWWKFEKSELTWKEWHEYLEDLCVLKELDKLEVTDALTNCGLPGTVNVRVPQYRDFFLTYKSKKALVICESLDSCGKPKKKTDKAGLGGVGPQGTWNI